MAAVFYIRLIGFAAGSLVHLFLIALILGHRRPRRFERVFFFLIFALFLFYSGGLLAINAQIHYASPPASTILFAMCLVALGLGALPGLLVQTHWEYFRLNGRRGSTWLSALAWVTYAPILYFGVRVVPQFLTGVSLHVLWPGSSAAKFYGVWLGVSLLISGAIELALAANGPKPLQSFHRFLAAFCMVVAALALYVYGAAGPSNPLWSDELATVVILAAIVPSSVLGYFIVRHNFLEIGAQQNLVYAVSAAFLALLYLGVVRRVSGWLEPVLPPEATASIFLFVLVIFFEPLERTIGRWLQRAMRQRMDRVQRLLGEIQEEARRGDLVKLVAFVERRVSEEFGLAQVRLVHSGISREPLRSPGGLGHVVRVPVLRDGHEFGVLEAASTGAVLTGETSVALEFIAEQLPALVDLCRLIEEKVGLERELAERERLALVGQMAASVSHNLRNPLSSMKTVLQVQIERGDLADHLRQDLALVLGEVDRLSEKLTQLLQYAKPAVEKSRVVRRADLGSVIEQVVSLLSRDAAQRHVMISVSGAGSENKVSGSEEALNEIFSNLIVNAVEAQPQGGRVGIEIASKDGNVRVAVSDAGPGIPSELKARILEPFFTTKASGTGLGLAIVMRRLKEIGGTLECESPALDGRGTRFVATLPRAGTKREGKTEP